MKHNASIIIPNYNGSILLRKNLPYVLAAGNKKNNRILEIIIVDDASKDDSVNVIKKHFPQVKLIKHKINRGFASSVNTGVRGSKGKLVVLLNTDVKPSVDFLKPVYEHFAEDDIFGVSLHEAGYGWAKANFENGFVTHRPGKESKKAKDTFWVSGGSGVFRRDLWIKLGGFDEKLFKFYWEDVDLSYRAAKRGLKLIWEPKARVLHKHESTISKVISKKKLSRMQEVNQLVFIWKNLTSQNMFRKHVLGLMARIIRHPGYIRIVFSALIKMRVITKARKKEKKQCKVSDEAIFAKF
jgi:GT2 family glycosyltransferase